MEVCSHCLCDWGMPWIASAIGVPLFVDECTTKQTRISYARILIEVNVTKAIPQQITVMDPNGGTFMQEVVLEWRPQFCDKCQKIGHQCQSGITTKEGPPKKRRPVKKVTQVWQYKGPIQLKEQVCAQNRGHEAREISHNITTEKGNHEIEKEHGKQNPGEITQLNLRPNTGGKHLDFSLTNFPILAAIPTRNGFESLMDIKLASLPIDRGATPTLADEVECVKDIDVTELQWMEHYYSWTNKQNGTDRISNRIDKFFGNYEWMEK
uniref:Endonuclease/exonuclease/phosphatase n=1 Tax=Solanum tuberosum TaxID=4113 RepID=M1B956_SOLTU